VGIRDLSPSTLFLLVLATGACTPDKPTETATDTAVDTGPIDTGDDSLPDPIDRYDGNYTGEFEATLTMGGEDGLSDTCIGTSEVGIFGLNTVPLQGTAPCSWLGMMGALFPDWSDPAAHFEGSITEEGTITGGINFGPVQDVITGVFEGDTSFVCAFEGSFEFTQEVRVFYEGRITGQILPAGE
jgi:hypothetical protein